MLNRIKLAIHNKETWIYQIQYMVYSIFLLGFVVAVDTNLVPLKDYVPGFFFTSIDLAISILSALAGALLTITTFTFSTIMAIATFYASSYTPRAIDDFIKSEIVLKILSIFMGGFFYAITGLMFMRDDYETSQVIAGTVGVLYAIFALIYFIRFVQQVLYSAKGVNLIRDITDQTSGVIRDELKRRETSAEVPQGMANGKPLPIKNDESGYLSTVHQDSLEELFDGRQVLIKMNKRIGDFVMEDEIIAEIYGDSDEADDTRSEKAASAFAVQDEKVPGRDYRYGISKLNEIAVRALSPGINDPMTAQHCIRKMSVLLSELFAVPLEAYATEKKGIFVLYNNLSAEEELYESFTQTLHYGKADIIIVRTVLEGLRNIYLHSCPEHRPAIGRYGEYVRKEVLAEITLSYDRRMLDQISGVWEKESPPAF